MANVTGKVITVAIDTPVKKKDGGSYQGWKLVYEDADGDVKTIAKHMNSLKYAAALKNGLENLKPGDNFTLEQEKEGDFWNPKNVYKSDAPTPTSKTAGSSARSTTASSNNSTYSTAEERAQTQVYIVRQSSITAALKLLELNGIKKNNVNDVLLLAKDFENYVLGFENRNKDIAKTVSEYLNDENSFDSMDDDIPF